MVDFFTQNNPDSFSPDTTFFEAEAALPGLLANEVATVAGSVDGDRPSIKVPRVSVDDAPDYVEEGSAIDPSDPESSELTIRASKLSVLVPASSESLRQNGIAGLLANSIARAMVRKANATLLSNPAPQGTDVHPVAGILAQVGPASADVEGNLDTLVEAVRQVEDAYGTASHILTSPSGWSELSRLKVTDSSNQPLLGAGVDAGVRQVLGLPVVVSPEVGASDLLVIDRSAILSAVSQLAVETSEHYYFNSDRVAIRALLRIGAVVADSDRVVRLSIGDDDS